MNILELAEQEGTQLKKVAHTHGGEYAGRCLKCGGHDRCRFWPEQREGGTFYCRVCDKTGDCIEYLKFYREMPFHDACAFLKIDPGNKRSVFNPNKPDWEPKEAVYPNATWIKKTSVYVNWCQGQLFSDAGKDALSYLKKRGLFEETIKASHLGWNPKKVFRCKKDWGLTEEFNDTGKPKTICFPDGWVIPFPQKVKIRLQNPRKEDPPYLPITGGYTGAVILGQNQKIFLIVESELCGILLHQEIGDLAGIVILGSAYIRPDKRITEILQKAELLLIALDSESHKEQNTGAKQSWNFWMKHFPNARRCPPVRGKDPGEMWENGVNLKLWVEVGIEQYPPTNKPENGGKIVQISDYRNQQSVSSCEKCRCLVTYKDYPLGGGPRKFCGYWIQEEGKSKKVDLDKLKECPKTKEVPKVAAAGTRR